MEKIQNAAVAMGYSQKFIAFLGKFKCIPAYDEVLTGIKRRLPEKDVLILCFYIPPIDGPIGTSEEVKDYCATPDLKSAKATYQRYCDKGGKFDYDAPFSMSHKQYDGPGLFG